MIIIRINLIDKNVEFIKETENELTKEIIKENINEDTIVGISRIVVSHANDANESLKPFITHLRFAKYVYKYFYNYIQNNENEKKI